LGGRRKQRLPGLVPLSLPQVAQPPTPAAAKPPSLQSPQPPSGQLAKRASLQMAKRPSGPAAQPPSGPAASGPAAQPPSGPAAQPPKRPRRPPALTWHRQDGYFTTGFITLKNRDVAPRERRCLRSVRHRAGPAAQVGDVAPNGYRRPGTLRHNGDPRGHKRRGETLLPPRGVKRSWLSSLPPNDRKFPCHLPLGESADMSDFGVSTSQSLSRWRNQKISTDDRGLSRGGP
jgi:hypothetical protein